MGFFKPVAKEELKDGGNSKYIGKSGVYPVIINAAFVDVNASGARTINFFVNYEGQDQVIYGNLRLDNNDGKPNQIGTRIFTELCVVCDVDPEEIGDPTEGTLPIGKKGAEKDVVVLEEFCDKEVLMQIQMEYGKYNGNITEKTNITKFYRADKASAAEIVNDSEVGVAYEKSTPYFENVKYSDGTDAETIAAWVSAKRPKGTADSGASAAPKKKVSFGKKK